MRLATLLFSDVLSDVAIRKIVRQLRQQAVAKWPFSRKSDNLKSRPGLCEENQLSFTIKLVKKICWRAYKPREPFRKHLIPLPAGPIRRKLAFLHHGTGEKSLLEGRIGPGNLFKKPCSCFQPGLYKENLLSFTMKLVKKAF